MAYAQVSGWLRATGHTGLPCISQWPAVKETGPWKEPTGVELGQHQKGRRLLSTPGVTKGTFLLPPTSGRPSDARPHRGPTATSPQHSTHSNYTPKPPGYRPKVSLPMPPPPAVPTENYTKENRRVSMRCGMDWGRPGIADTRASGRTQDTTAAVSMATTPTPPSNGNDRPAGARHQGK